MHAEQLDLLSDDTPTPFPLDAVKGKAKGYSLFFALRPELECAQRIAQTASDLRKQHGLTGGGISADRLHLSLHAIEHGGGFVSQDMVDAARTAAARVKCAAPRIVFDQFRTFDHSSAYVLRCDADSDSAVKHLRDFLKAELRRFSLRYEESQSPHMTLLYDEHKTGPHAVEPIRWTAKRLALILSHVGAHHHQHVAEWPLA